MTDVTAAAKPIVVVGYGGDHFRPINKDEPRKSGCMMFRVYTEDTPSTELVEQIIRDSATWKTFSYATITPDEPSYDMWLSQVTPAANEATNDLWLDRETPVTNGMAQVPPSVKGIVVAVCGASYVDRVKNKEPVSGDCGRFIVYREDTPLKDRIHHILCGADAWDDFRCFVVSPDEPAYRLWLDYETPAIDIWNTHHASASDDLDDRRDFDLSPELALEM